MKCGFASGFAFGYDPTGRSDYFRLILIDRIPYFDTCPPEEDSLFLVRCLQSAGGGFVIHFFKSFILDLTSSSAANGLADPPAEHLKPETYTTLIRPDLSTTRLQAKRSSNNVLLKRSAH
jgi:hypothetical protein